MYSLLSFKSLLLVFLLFISPLLFADTRSLQPIHWHEWSETAFTRAQQEGKLVLLDIGAEWCQYCKKMDAVTYQDAEVIRIINKNYIAIKADIEHTEEVKILYGDFGVPATIVLNANMDEINKRLGYIPPQHMQWHLLGVLQDS